MKYLKHCGRKQLVETPSNRYVYTVYTVLTAHLSLYRMDFIFRMYDKMYVRTYVSHQLLYFMIVNSINCTYDGGQVC